VRWLRERLRKVYGVPGWPPHQRPLDELILTVLSQSTNDRNRDVAFAALRERFDGWAAVRDAPVEDVEAAIRPGGISHVKSRRIQQILRALPDDLDLGWLRDEPVDQGRDFLCALPGVGRKTAACVLLFSYGRRDVPVDTHDEMVALTPPGAELELHVNLLRHGRRTCLARAPRCRECVLRRSCPSAQL
jgi:endonuclease-3